MSSEFATVGVEAAKPCQFCGMQPMVHKHTYNADRIPVYQIFHCISGTHWMKDFNDALRDWNRRPGDLQETEEKEREVIG